MPSLLIGVTWLAGYIREHQEDAALFLPFVHQLIQPVLGQDEAARTHATIVSILKFPFEACVNTIKGRAPDATARPALGIIATKRSLARAARLRPPDLSTLAANSDGLLNTFRDKLKTIIQWSTHRAMANVMPVYAYEIVRVNLEFVGAKRVLDTVVNEIREQAKTGFKEVAMDISTALMFSTFIQEGDPSRPGDYLAAPRLHGRLTLRRALQLEANNAHKLGLEDNTKVELYAELGRRVEAMIAETSLAAENIQLPAADMMGDVDLNAAVQLEGTNEASGLDLSGADAGLQLDMDAAFTGQPDTTTTDLGVGMDTGDDDIFGDLQLDENMQMDFL